MEKFVSKKNSKKYGFNNGDELFILRNIMGECVLIVKDKHTPNIIMSEKTVRYYGTLTGTPTLGGC